MEKVDIQEETVVDNQQVTIQKKLEKLLGHLDPANLPEVCPIKDLLATVSDKWSILVILMLGAYGTLRFNELKRLIIGISAKVLTERLKRMERDGYLDRTVFAEVPIRVEYKLSDFGLGYLNQLLNLVEWIDREAPEIIKRRMRFDIFRPDNQNN